MPQTKHDPQLGWKKSKTTKSVTRAAPKCPSQSEQKPNVVRSTGLKSRRRSKLPSESPSRPSVEIGYITPISAEGKKVKKEKKEKKEMKEMKEKKEKKEKKKKKDKKRTQTPTSATLPCIPQYTQA